MATIQKRKATDGTPRYRVQVRMQGYPPETATFRSRTDAKAWAQRRETSMREGKAFPEREAKRHTLAGLIDRHLEHVKKKRGPEYYKRQMTQLSWWRRNLGDFALAQVTPARIAEYRDKLLAENTGTEKRPRYRAPATANRYLHALSAVLKNATQEWHLLPDNPVHRVGKEKEPRGRVRYLSDEERKALLDACRKSELPELYLIVLFALTTGMRRGEILGLRWPDIDLDRRLVILTKTKNMDRRSVPIVPEIADLLREHWKAQRLEKVRRLDNDL